METPARDLNCMNGWLHPNPVVLRAAPAREPRQISLRAGSVVTPLHNPIRGVEEWTMLYRLTRKGRKQLETEAANWQRLTEAISLILKLSAGGVK
jgi:hypothetical protein